MLEDSTEFSLVSLFQEESMNADELRTILTEVLDANAEFRVFVHLYYDRNRTEIPKMHRILLS